MSYAKTYEKIVEMLYFFDRDIKIIDLGCGGCKLVGMLREKGFKNVSHCDINSFSNKETIIMDLNKRFNFDNNSFDVALSTDVIEHIENKFFFFREVQRILKKGGTFIFSTPNIFNFYNRIYFLFRSRFVEFPHYEISKGVIFKHTNPIFIWDIPDFFKTEVTYNRGFIPILRLPFFKCRLFGQELIVKCVT